MNAIEAAERMEKGAQVLRSLPKNVIDKLKWITVDVKDKEFTLYPDDTTEARRIVGSFVLEGVLMKVKRSWDARSLIALLPWGGWTFEVTEYKPTTCRLVKREKIIPATPAREAQPERTVTEEVIVCEGTELKA